MAELSVLIGGDEKELKKSLKNAEKALNNFEKNAQKATGPLGGGSNNPLKKGAKNFDKLKKSTANAVPTLNEFSRVIQDAPFGIQGVANNITQLVDQFGNLTKRTGSSKEAFKALLGSLTGPAGILLAVSAVTSILVAYSDEIFKSKKATNELVESQKDAVGSAKAEISTLNALLSVAKDETETKVNRQRAIDKINDQYGDYIPNLNLENIATQKVTDSVDNLTKSLIRQAQVRGIQDQISKEQSKSFEIQAKGIQEQVGFLDILLAKTLNLGDVTSTATDLVSKGQKKQQEELAKTSESVEFLTNKLQELIKEDINLGGVETFTKNVQKKAKESPVRLTIEPISTIQAEQSLATIAKSADITGEILKPIDNSLAKQQIQFFRAQQSAQIFSNAAGSAINAFGNQVVQSLGVSNDAVGAFVSSIISSLSQLLTATLTNAVQNIAIQQANSTANAVAGATQSAVATGPGAAFVLPGLIAASVAAVAAAFAGIAGFNNGGFVGDRNVVRVNGNEMILNPIQQTRLFNMIRNGNAQGSLSGSSVSGSETTPIVETRLRGSDILLSVKRQGRKNNRFGG